jgi:hypothetical protein
VKKIMVGCDLAAKLVKIWVETINCGLKIDEFSACWTYELSRLQRNLLTKLTGLTRFSYIFHPEYPVYLVYKMGIPILSGDWTSRTRA